MLSCESSCIEVWLSIYLVTFYQRIRAFHTRNALAVIFSIFFGTMHWTNEDEKLMGLQLCLDVFNRMLVPGIDLGDLIEPTYRKHGKAIAKRFMEMLEDDRYSHKSFPVRLVRMMVFFIPQYDVICELLSQGALIDIVNRAWASQNPDIYFASRYACRLLVS